MSWESIIGGIAIALLGMANAWVIFMVTLQRDDVKELRAVDTDLGKDLAAIKVLVAGQYVTRDEFNLALRGQSDLILGRMDALSAQISERQQRP